MSGYTKELQLLQNQYDSYEKYSLIIKLFSIATLVFSFAYQLSTLFVIAILVLVWFQEAIWKTFQARIEHRLLTVENAIKIDIEGKADKTIFAFQYNSEFLNNRPSTAGLVKEYLSNAVRPTVAFPHAVLIAIVLLPF